MYSKYSTQCTVNIQHSVQFSQCSVNIRFPCTFNSKVLAGLFFSYLLPYHNVECSHVTQSYSKIPITRSVHCKFNVNNILIIQIHVMLLFTLYGNCKHLCRWSKVPLSSQSHITNNLLITNASISHHTPTRPHKHI